MANPDFHPIGFSFPLILGVIYVLRTVARATHLDWLLLASGTILTWMTMRASAEGIHMVEAFAFAVLLKMFMNLKADPVNALPASSIFLLFFSSMAIPDVWGAVHLADGRLATVGGASFFDGLFLWPMGASLVYLGSSWIQWRFSGPAVKSSMSGREFLSHHFSPRPNAI